MDVLCKLCFHSSYHVSMLVCSFLLSYSRLLLEPLQAFSFSQYHHRRSAYLFSSSARFLRSAFVSGVGRLSATTGPYSC